MGRFDGILICSDWDGTLFTNGTVPEESSNAIRYFQENGGLFTVCSGRAPEFLNNYSHLVRPNTYALCYNGALICDLDSGEVIRSSFATEEIFDVMNVVLSCGATFKTVNVSIDRDGKRDLLHYSAEEFLRDIEKIKKFNIYKMTVNAECEENALKIASVVNELGFSDYVAVRSFYSYPEILRKSNMKGAAATFLKEFVGARLLVGVGDYENDFDLIEKADIGYAVGNAIDALKERADRVTARVDECAIARIIDELEREFADTQ